MPSLKEDIVRAARAGDLDKVKRLIEHRDADINAYYYDHWELSGRANYPLDAACGSGNMDLVEYLLSHDDINPPKARYAAEVLKTARYDLFNKMITKGLDINAWYKTRDDKYKTFLIESIERKDKATFDYLMRKEDIDINAVDQNESALIASFSVQEIYYREQLVKSGVSINHQNQAGETPLMVLAKTQKESVLKEFLSLNPDLDVIDNNGLTFLGHAHAGVRDFVELYRLSKNVDLVTFSYKNGSTIIQDVFNFKTHEKNTFVRHGITEPVQVMTQTPFDQVPLKALQMAFNEHVRRGGTSKAHEVGVADQTDKPKMSPVIQRKGGGLKP